MLPSIVCVFPEPAGHAKSYAAKGCLSEQELTRGSIGENGGIVPMKCRVDERRDFREHFILTDVTVPHCVENVLLGGPFFAPHTTR